MGALEELQDLADRGLAIDGDVRRLAAAVLELQPPPEEKATEKKVAKTAKGK